MMIRQEIAPCQSPEPIVYAMQPKSDSITRRLTSPTDPITHAGEIALRYTLGETQTPVAAYQLPNELESQLDLTICKEGESTDQVMRALEELANATPRSTSTRFCNQLFSGSDPIATAADMLVPVINTSLYTFKAAGPMAMIERIIIAKMAGLLGFNGSPNKPEGIFTPGGSISNLVAMLIARNETCPTLRNEGSQGKRIICYASADAHYSIIKNAGILGMGRQNVRQIPTDNTGAMNLSILHQTVHDDLDAGHLPSMIIATAGTTVRGAFDSIDQIIPIAREFGVWVHVDACFGGAASLSPTHRHLLNGVELADSVAWNPHKVMGVPLSAATLITRKSGYLSKNFDETADYLFQGDDDALNPGTRSIQCGRRNDALKVWAAWKHHGDIGYRDRIDHLMSIAQYAASGIKAHDALILSCKPTYVNVCFEVVGKSSRAICDLLRERNELLVGHAEVDGRRVIRIPFVNGAITTDDADEMLELILNAAQTLPAGDNAITSAPNC